MIRICAWCNGDMGEKEPLEDPRISHGCCDECLKELKGGQHDSKTKTMVSQHDHKYRVGRHQGAW